ACITGCAGARRLAAPIGAGWIALTLGDTKSSASLLQPSGGDLRVIAIPKRLLDERSQDRIPEDLEPGDAGARLSLRRAVLPVDLIWHGDRWSLVVRADSGAT